MKFKSILVGSFSALLLTSACNAGWLHQSYQGVFCAHDHKYVVNGDGTVNIQTKEYPNGVLMSGPADYKLVWQTDLTFANLNDLDNVIGDLQKVSKELHKNWGDTEDTTCASNCENSK